MERNIQERSFVLARRICSLARDDDYRVTVRRTVIRQLVRSATSVGANLEEAPGAQTKAGFVAKLSVARKECREMNFWLRLGQSLGVVPGSDLEAVRQQAMEVSRIVAAVTRTAKRSDN